MGFRVEPSPAGVTVRLTGLDRLLTWRRSITILTSEVRSVALLERGALEAAVDHRVVGIGPHDGARRPGRHRVGIMLGRDVVGRQLWAVAEGPPTRRLLVLDVVDLPFVRAVLQVAEPGAWAARLERERRRLGSS